MPIVVTQRRESEPKIYREFNTLSFSPVTILRILIATSIATAIRSLGGVILHLKQSGVFDDKLRYAPSSRTGHLRKYGFLKSRYLESTWEFSDERKPSLDRLGWRILWCRVYHIAKHFQFHSCYSRKTHPLASKSCYAKASRTNPTGSGTLARLWRFNYVVCKLICLFCYVRRYQKPLAEPSPARLCFRLMGISETCLALAGGALDS